MDRIVIIGAGQAGIGAAAELRRLGYAGTVTVVGDESHAPYQRPPLSKELLVAGPAPTLYLYPSSYYRDNNIALALGRRAVAIDRTAQRVALDDDTQLPYDHLLLATGSRPRSLDAPGLASATTLRTLDDATAIAAQCGDWSSVAIVGGGFIGLELAAFLRKRSIPVTVLEAAHQLMGRVVSPVTSEFFRSLHGDWGTDIRLDCKALAGDHAGARWTLQLSTGETLHCGAVIAAVGALANTGLAETAGLNVDRGIVVDEMLLTSDPSISAIGDCAVHPDAASGRPVRLESVQNAVDQGKSFASRIVGQPQPYRSVPWFWSTQGSAKLQIAGLAHDVTTDILRSVAGTERMSLFRYARDRLVAVETVNSPGDHLIARRLLTAGIEVAKSDAADPAFNLKSLL